MRMVERTIASGICFASAGHGCESVLISATRPRANAQVVKNTIVPMIKRSHDGADALALFGRELRTARKRVDRAADHPE